MMKYVISDKDEFAIGRGGFHKDLAHGFKGRVEAAGYCVIGNGIVSVSGKSDGFGIEAKPEDAARLTHLIANAQI